MKFKIVDLVYLVWATFLVILVMVLFPGVEKFKIGKEVGTASVFAMLVWILHSAFSILTPQFSSRFSDNAPIIDFRVLVGFLLLGSTLVMICEGLKVFEIAWMKYVLFASIIPAGGIFIFQMTDSAYNITQRLSWRLHLLTMGLFMLFLSAGIVFKD